MSQDLLRHFAERRDAWRQQPAPPLRISIEVFPPKTPEAAGRLDGVLERLKPLQPEYVSVTCGAGGNPAEGTSAMVDQVRSRSGLRAAAHLTCASASRPVVEAIARDYLRRGIDHIVALRGDLPKDGSGRGPDHHPFAADLVAALRALGTAEISVAGYPEVHPEAASAAADLDHLKRKVDAGAARVITQYCFTTEAILRFRDAMTRAGITVPLSVGILPVRDYVQVRRFSQRCGAGVPGWLDTLFAGTEDDPARRVEIGAAIAAEQIRRLAGEGLHEVHFYILNRADPTLTACRLLGLVGPLAAAA